MILGVGEAGYFPAGTALMSDYFCREKRSRIMSWWSVAQLVGILVGFVVGGEVAGLYRGAWRLAFIFTGIPGLLLAFLVWRIREPRRNQADEEDMGIYEARVATNAAPRDEHTASVPTNVFAQFGALLRIRTLVVLILMQIFAFFVLTVNVSLFADIFTAERHLWSHVRAGRTLFRCGRCLSWHGWYSVGRLYG